jgi:hypothetical protein
VKNVRIARVACLLLAAFFLLLSAYGFLWVLSSSSMAFTECNGGWSLTATNARCRQVPIAALLCLSGLVASVGCFVFARRFRK